MLETPNKKIKMSPNDEKEEVKVPEKKSFGDKSSVPLESL